MHRLLVESALLNEESPVLPADAARHLKVLRPKDGESIELFDGKGRWRTYRFERSGEDAPRIAPASQLASLGGYASPLNAHSNIRTIEQSNNSLTLFACVTKGSRWDWTIEKATELGATRIVPVLSERTIVRIPKDERAAKRERWMRIAEDAARQSDAKWLPEICEAVDFKDALPLVRETTCFIGALTTPPSPPLARAIEQSNNRTIEHFSAFIGPEGAFTPDELAALMEIATPTSFGPTILRAETAAIFALSVLASSMHGEQRT